MSEMGERVAHAVREEIVRQYRDDERGKCPAGPHYYEESIAPFLIAKVAIAAMREPTEAMVDQVARAIEAQSNYVISQHHAKALARATIAALAD